MSYGFDSKRDEAYMEGPISSATTSLFRVAGELFPLCCSFLELVANDTQEDGVTSGKLSLVEVDPC